MIELDHVTKTFGRRRPDGGGRRPVAHRRRRRGRRPRRQLRLRQDHDAADDQPADRADAAAASPSTGATSSTLPAHELRRGIGYVIQQGGLFPHRTVLGNVGTVPAPARLGQGADDGARRASCSTSSDSTPALADRYPAQLSGGQQQRVGVARALAADPPVLLMDEPFGAVDPIVRAQLQREFARLQRELGKTVVFVTHDVDEAIILADRIAVLEPGGRLAQLATPAELLANPASDFVADFLGEPHRRVRGRRAGRLPHRVALRAGVRPGRAPTPGPWREPRRCGAAVERPPARRELGRHLVLHAAARPLHRARRRARLRVRPARPPTSPCATAARTRCCWRSPTWSTRSRRSRCSCCSRRGSAISTTSRSSSPWPCTRW